jgi:hypothetical protein
MKKDDKLLARIPETVWFSETENLVAVYARKPRVRPWEKTTPTVSVVKNTPVEKIRILGVKRSSKRRDSWTIEFPYEDRILKSVVSTLVIESILTSPVSRTEDGWFIGPFSWAILNMREVTLVHTETTMGEKVREAAKIYSVPYLKLEDAVPGSIYGTRAGDCYAYLGELEKDEIVSKLTEPWQIKTVSFKPWVSVYADGSLSNYFYEEPPGAVLEPVVATVDVSDDYFQMVRTYVNRGSYYSATDFETFKRYYSQITVRKVGEPCPKIPDSFTEVVWRANYDTAMRRWPPYR